MNKKDLLKSILIFVCVIMGTLTYTKTLKAGYHKITIKSPTENSVITNSCNRVIKNGEQDYILFKYTIENYDRYYCSYCVYIDGQPRGDLVRAFDENTEALDTYYELNARQFLSTYGQGMHTFKIIGYHRIPSSNLNPGLTPDPNSEGYIYTMDIVSVNFTFNPRVVHFVAFWFVENNIAWKDSILPFYDLLRSENAHYLFGYHYMTGSWDDDKPGAIFKNDLAPAEDANDIDIIMFYSHGRNLGILGHFLVCPRGFGTEKCLTRNELKKSLLAANLDSSTIILIIDCCYSGMFIDAFKDTNIIVLTSCTSSEPSSYTGDNYYDYSWPIEQKIYEMNSLFLHSLIQGLYYQRSLYSTATNIVTWSFFDPDFSPGISTNRYFDHNPYDKPNAIYGKHGNDGTQHPQYLHIEHQDLIFYDNPKV